MPLGIDGVRQNGHGNALILLSRLSNAPGSLRRKFCLQNRQLLIFL